MKHAFKKIARLFGVAFVGSDDPMSRELASLNKDGRLHARYLIKDRDVAWIEIDGGLAGEVKDLSYGGAAVRLSVKGITASLPKAIAGYLWVLDRRVRCSFNLIRVIPEGKDFLYVGLTILHESPETLLFLRDLIEPLRYGKSLMKVPTELRQPHLQGPEWGCFRGDGPTDLLTRAAGPEGAEALLTFRFQDDYCEVALRRSKLQTRLNASKPANALGISGQMQPTRDLDHVALRQAAAILLGTTGEVRQSCLPLLETILQVLLKNRPVSSAA